MRGFGIMPILIPNTAGWAGPVRFLEDALGTALAVPLMKRGLQKAFGHISSSLYIPSVHYARHRREAMHFLSDAPQTLVHHDCHPGNLFWNKNRSAVGFLDWQLVRIGEGVSDVAHLVYAFEAMVVTLAVGDMMNLDCNLELVRRTAAAVEQLDAFSVLQI